MKKQNRLSKLEEISMIEVQIQNLENEFQLCLGEKRQAEKYYRSSIDGHIYDPTLWGYNHKSSKILLEELRDILIQIQFNQSYLESLREKSSYFWNMESENQRKQR